MKSSPFDLLLARFSDGSAACVLARAGSSLLTAGVLATSSLGWTSKTSLRFIVVLRRGIA